MALTYPEPGERARWAQVGSQATWMPNERAICPGAAQWDPNCRPKEGNKGAWLSGLASGASVQVCSSLLRPPCSARPAPPHL